MIARLTGDVPRRSLLLLAALFLIFLLLPIFAGDYLLTVLILILYLPTQDLPGTSSSVLPRSCRSVMHSMSAAELIRTAALYVHFGTRAVDRLAPAISIAALTGAFSASSPSGPMLAASTSQSSPSRLRIRARWFDHLAGPMLGGLFLPVAQYAHNDLWQLRGHPVMFYYVLLAATVLAFVLCRALLKSRIGYFWLAIREDEKPPLGRHRHLPLQNAGRGDLRRNDLVCRRDLRVLLQQPVSRAGVQISRSIDIILGPIVGGVGTLFGPILGEFLLEILGGRACERC